VARVSPVVAHGIGELRAQSYKLVTKCSDL
jgi:hypothetical protein